MTEAFTAPWTSRLVEELASDSSFRSAAAGWKGNLGLSMRAAGGLQRMVILELADGRCKSSGNDPSALVPDYVIEARVDTWERVFDGKLDPMWGLMSGKLRLAKGSLSELAAQGAAALKIVECARRIPTVFPAKSARRF